MKFFGFWVFFFFCPLVSAQELNLYGMVLDPTGSPLSGVEVELLGLELKTLTDAEGRYQFSQNTPVNHALEGSFSPVLQGWDLRFQTEEPGISIRVDVYDLQGRRLFAHSLVSGAAGSQEVSLARAASQLRGPGMVRLQVGPSAFQFKWLPEFSSDSRREISLTPARRLNRSASRALPDSLLFTLEGYENAVIRTDVYDVGELGDVTLNTGIAFIPFFEGSGLITDLATGGDLHIPKEKRLHVFVLPEGYTQAELTGGAYESDLESWYDENFSLQIMDYFKEAFIVWKYAAPSNQQLTGEGVVDSYFALPLSGGLMAGSGYEEPAARTWEVIEKFPFTPVDYESHLGAVNLISSFILYDPQRRGAGYSGQARTFTDPEQNSRRVSVAMAMGHSHEFQHAMSRLLDEYYELDHGPLSDNTLREEARYITNVISSPACETLPWKHLLPGGTINPDVDSLVGAFGANGRFHPTLKCLLNGSHDNGILYGGSNNLRTNGRMCNWCREVAAFRIYERVGVFPDADVSWQTWVAQYREQFYQVLGFDVPATVPQENSEGEAVFFPCTP